LSGGGPGILRQLMPSVHQNLDRFRKIKPLQFYELENISADASKQ
jgi:hypothetical protein